MGITPSFDDSWIFLRIPFSEKEGIIGFSYSTNLKGKRLSSLHSFRIPRFPVDTEGKFCYDGGYSNTENSLLTEMYSVEPCEKGEFPHAKETDYLHERRPPLLPIRL